MEAILIDAIEALSSADWQVPRSWRGAVSSDAFSAAWSASTDARAMLRIIESMSSLQCHRGVFLVPSGPQDRGYGKEPLAPDWSVAIGDVFRVRFMTSDGGHTEFEGDDELVSEIRKRFPRVTIADVLAERGRIFGASR